MEMEFWQVHMETLVFPPSALGTLLFVWANSGLRVFNLAMVISWWFFLGLFQLMVVLFGPSFILYPFAMEFVLSLQWSLLFHLSLFFGPMVLYLSILGLNSLVLFVLFLVVLVLLFLYTWYGIYCAYYGSLGVHLGHLLVNQKI